MIVVKGIFFRIYIFFKKWDVEIMSCTCINLPKKSRYHITYSPFDEINSLCDSLRRGSSNILNPGVSVEHGISKYTHSLHLHRRTDALFSLRIGYHYPAEASISFNETNEEQTIDMLLVKHQNALLQQIIIDVCDRKTFPWRKLFEKIQIILPGCFRYWFLNIFFIYCLQLT